jgi:hypothetical protein
MQTGSPYASSGCSSHGRSAYAKGNAGGDDYVANFRNGATAISSIDVKLPMTLRPGDGVRVPLFVSAATEDRHDRWCRR